MHDVARVNYGIACTPMGFAWNFPPEGAEGGCQTWKVPARTGTAIAPGSMVPRPPSDSSSAGKSCSFVCCAGRIGTHGGSVHIRPHVDQRSDTALQPRAWLHRMQARTDRTGQHVEAAVIGAGVVEIHADVQPTLRLPRVREVRPDPCVLMPAAARPHTHGPNGSAADEPIF
eukprot:SAG11_NODE_302_length_11005_cov_12.491748_9_plen_172_part_00